MSTGTDTAIDRGLAFLADRQLPTGGFSLRYGFDLASEETVADDHTLFGPALIGHSLLACDRPAASEILGRVAHYLRSRMEPGGVWRHWSLPEPRHHLTGPDVDDSSLIPLLLRSRGLEVPDNRAVLLANRDPRGLFWTWMIARWPPPRSVRLWQIALKRYRHPLWARALWASTPAERDDVDGIVNANVLFHLGDGPHAGPIVERLVDVFRRGQEGRCDKWYRGLPTFCWAVSRAARTGGVRGLDRIRDEACERLRSATGPDGRIGAGPLDTALAVCALAEWQAEPPERERALEFLGASQGPDGSWPAEAFYYASSRIDPPTERWGSRELTTAFCVEALSRCRAT